MKYCPNPDCLGLEKFKIISEYNDSATVCADCQTALLDGAAPESFSSDKAEPTPNMELVSVASVRNESEVLLIESLLIDAEIPYLARGERIQDLFGMGRLVGVNPITELVEFLVAEDNAEDARVVLSDFISRDQN